MNIGGNTTAVFNIKMRDISKVDIPRFAWQPQKPFVDSRPVIGFDTETVNGYARLITCSDGTHAFTNSFEECARFITAKKYRKTLNFFYNLRYDYSAVLKWLPESELRELVKNQQVDYAGYRIRYIPIKFFQMATGAKYSHRVAFFDLAQFYHMKLATAAKYVKMEKGDYDVGAMTEEKLNDPLLLKYAIHDAVICGKLGAYFKDMISRMVSVRRYYSCASIAKRYILTRGERYSLPREPKLLDIALKSYQGGRFEVLQRGMFEKLYTYDINSAYPEQIAALDSCEGTIKHNTEYEPDSVHSFFKCDAEVYNVMLSPMKWQMKSGLMVYPAGGFKDVHLTKREYELMNDLGFPLKIHEAIHIFHSEPTKPFAWFQELYDARLKLKEDHDDLQLAYKYVMNSTYGCMIQGKKQLKPVDYPTEEWDIVDGEIRFKDGRYKAGALFNPIWAAEITANTRVKIFRDFERQANQMVSIATDGVMLTEKARVPEGKKLGEYDYEEDKGIVIGSGIYRTENKSRFRGFGRDDGHNPKYDLFKALAANMEKTLIPFERIRPKGIKESLIQDELGKEAINQFMPESRVLNLNFDTKRNWERPFQSARDCLTNKICSVPLAATSW
jgi:hypothetical protein